jgi:predicted lipoprotein with Yx(FWY)xxD motif
MYSKYPPRNIAHAVGILAGMRPGSLALLAAVPLAVCACGSSSDSGRTTDAKAPVSSAQKAKVGHVIVDARGRTLYRFTAEAQGRPVCMGDCAKTWPPATVAADTGLPAHVATVKRPDGGALQLTYDGHPLYRYAGDKTSDDAKGDGVGGQWYAVKAGGGESGSGGGGTATQESKRDYGY